jgi:hypothetical protein
MTRPDVDVGATFADLVLFARDSARTRRHTIDLIYAATFPTPALPGRPFLASGRHRTAILAIALKRCIGSKHLERATSSFLLPAFHCQSKRRGVSSTLHLDTSMRRGSIHPGRSTADIYLARTLRAALMALALLGSSTVTCLV